MGKQNRRFSVFFTHTTKRLIEKKSQYFKVS